MAAAGALSLLLVASCGYPDPAPERGPSASVGETTPPPSAGADDFNEGSDKTPVKFPDGLQYIDLKVGSGATVQPGASVNVQYTGWLASNGQKFDSSRDRGGQTLCAILADVQQPQGDCTPVIPGWNEGVPGMKVGGRRKITMPPALGYGDQGTGPIPANSTLVFTVELVSIAAQPSPGPAGAAAPSPSPSQ
jgi:FKBP-type peptidyl-prolyl cis-trans isomerase